MEIIELCGVENFLKISLVSKQFYFLIKSDNFWSKLLRERKICESKIEEKRKTKSLMRIFRDLTYEVTVSIGGIDGTSNFRKYRGLKSTSFANGFKAVVKEKKKKFFFLLFFFCFF